MARGDDHAKCFVRTVHISEGVSGNGIDMQLGYSDLIYTYEVKAGTRGGNV